MNGKMEQRIALLEDIEAIKQLKHRYCHLVDEGIAGNSQKLDELMTHFVEDAWIDFSEFGVHKGKAAVEGFFKDVVAQSLSYSAQMVVNPVIEVNGDNAVGSWYVIVPCTFRQNNAPTWLQGRYDETYVKINGKWKWQSMTTRFDFITPFDEGWVKTRMMNS